MTEPLRVALLCHSVNPRGGVVHAMELATALHDLGHAPVVHAPDPAARGFFRPTVFETVCVEAAPVDGDTHDMVTTRVADYRRHFAKPENRRFDVFHAQDGISGNALATLKDDGLVRAFVRTVHHLDAFADARVAALQTRSVTTSDAQIVVSDLWRTVLRARYGLEATLAGNGVDARRFRPDPDGREATLRVRLGLGSGPVILSVGGVEERKNARRLLEAFGQVRRFHERAQLVIAGGASVLDHGDYRAAFERDVAASGLPPSALIRTGPLPDADMPALYRIADVLAFPSVREGFGLVALEAMASGTPVAASRIAPFTEYLGDGDVAWCDPLNPGSIANALMLALAEPVRSQLAERGQAVALRRDWLSVARTHLDVYSRLTEAAHA
ncbi:glycosyltransferase-like protein [Methylopila capsulata]|uniref:Glycosyl transferase family 1 n=1 Tax=Methylopila capsulata TaxID=61654 RepID=A0A9W6MQB7_9HYPH|nr:MSMEG_0565 family glycosyltransferase [Methylopila capsulata]MBM7850984.1 glycosyltransferase-like protein [Methylopila capsulata]GLK54042.1 glycosyl transferase family 1 [Methylopila capsulata]